MRKKSVSLLLAFTIIFTSVGLPVFSETLTSDFGAETVSSQTQTEEVVPSVSPNSNGEIPPTVSPNTNVEVAETELPDTDNLDASPDVSPKADDKAEIKNDESVVLFGDAVDLISQLTAGAVTIDANGKYAVTSLTTTNNIVIKTGVSAELTLTDVSITSTNAAPIKVESGASLTLHISGENTLTAPSYYAGIAVYANDTTSDYGTLIIDGDGILNANGGTTHGAGIGTNRSGKDSSTGITGKIIINGGTINAKGGKGGAGIGSSFPNPTSLKFVLGAIEINGGIITAVGGNQAAGIGGTAGISNGNITINGGYINATSASITAYGIGPGASGTADAAGAVVINGGSVDAVVSTMCPPTDKFGASVKQIMLSMPASADAANKEVTVGSWTAVTDESGNLYPYVTDNTTSFALQYDGKIYYVADINAETTEYTLIEYDGAPCICTEGNSSATLDMPDSITVNKLAGQATEKLVSTFHPVDGCTYPIHAASAEYELTIDGAAADNTLAQISDNHLVVYYAAADKILHLKTTVTMDGKLYTDEKDITVIGDNASRFDISKGRDQMQHIEICRDIAQRFNAIYGDVFKIPEGMLSKSGAKIMSLQEPEKKMSKSDPNPKGYISMMDDMNVIAKKIKSAVTDSEGVIEYRENDPTKAGINNLLSIMSAVTGRGIEDIVNDYQGKGYGDFKSDVAEAVVESIRPVRNEFDKLIADKQYLMDICEKGADSARRISQRTLKKVYKKVGFVI